MRLAIGGDHAGFALKANLVETLRAAGHAVTDFGAYTPEPVDFPDIVQPVCAAVRTGSAERGLLVCGTGIGACIAANKLPGIRAALAHDAYSAHQCVEHDDANVLCLGAQIVGEPLARDLAGIYLAARFSGEAQFRRRLAKLAALERPTD